MVFTTIIAENNKFKHPRNQPSTPIMHQSNADGDKVIKKGGVRL